MKLCSYILYIVYYEEITIFSNVFDEKCRKAVCKRKRSKLLSRSKLMSPTVKRAFFTLASRKNQFLSCAKAERNG